MRFLFFSSVFLVCLQFLGAGDCFYNFKPAFSKLKKERQSLNTFVKEGPALLLDGRHPSVGNHVGQTFYFPKKERDFLKGKNNSDWQANFDWLIKDANMAKVLDGNYDNRNKVGANGVAISNTKSDLEGVF